MTTFWSIYISVLTLGTICALAWLLFATRQGQRKDTTDEKVAHSFDNIEEYDNPLPKWWIILFVATMIFALGYLILYPGLGNWKGLLPGYQDRSEFTTGEKGWSRIHQWEKETEIANKKFDPIYASFRESNIEDLAKNEEALKIGNRIFASNCAVCHGSDGKGAYGFPNLTDDEWRWGGSPKQITETLINGRQGAMPAWLDTLGETGIQNTAAYVMTNFMDRPIPKNITQKDIEEGRKNYETTCVACHGPNGTGNHEVGAPNLNRPDAFIYGSNFEQVKHSLRYGRGNRMPAQKSHLGEDRVHLLAAYVYSLSHSNNN